MVHELKLFFATGIYVEIEMRECKVFGVIQCCVWVESVTENSK